MMLLYQLPWMFTYKSWSREYDYMLNPAVRSGPHHGRLKPYNLFARKTSAPTAAWLQVGAAFPVHAILYKQANNNMLALA